MHTTKLRKVGRSVMEAVPKAMFETLHLRPGEKVGPAVRHGRLIVEPQRRPHYTLDDLLAKCNSEVRRGKEARQWFNSKPIGAELI